MVMRCIFEYFQKKRKKVVEEEIINNLLYDNNYFNIIFETFHNILNTIYKKKYNKKY